MSSISSAARVDSHLREFGPRRPLILSPRIAATAAIVLPFRDLIGKTWQQKGLAIPLLSFRTE